MRAIFRVLYPDDLELGRGLGRRFWGNGYASEAASAWLAYAFDTLGAKKVISITETINVRSVAVTKRIGMKFDHAARLAEGQDSFDAVIFAINAAE